MEMTCICGHVEDEHFPYNGHTPSACEIDDCDCAQFQYTGDEVDE